MENYNRIDTSMTAVKYMEIVDNIVEKFFDENGNYQPHWGRLGTLAIFYSLFCKKEDESEMDTAQLNELLNDGVFMQRYDACINGNDRSGLFDFYDAYQDAMKIVDDRRSFAGTVRNVTKLVLDKIDNLFNNVLSEDKISELGKLAGLVNDGQLTPEAIVDAFTGKLDDTIAEQNARWQQNDTKARKIKQFQKKGSE